MEWESDLYDFSDPEVRLKYEATLKGAGRGTRLLPRVIGSTI